MHTRGCAEILPRASIIIPQCLCSNSHIVHQERVVASTLPPPPLLYQLPDTLPYYYMAAVSLSPLPSTLSAMSGRRVPLSNNTNAANSPIRAVAFAAQKQKRSYATIQREDAYGQPPPAKKQMLESCQLLKTPPRLQQAQQSAEGRVFTRRSNSTHQTEFERKCVAVGQARPVQKQASQRVVKEDHAAEEKNAEALRNWRKHTRKTFPQFVFYFENIPSDLHSRCAPAVRGLGAVSLLSECVTDLANVPSSVLTSFSPAKSHTS